MDTCSRSVYYTRMIVRCGIVGLILTTATFMEKRHARECPADETLGAVLDDWARIWLGAWFVLVIADKFLWVGPTCPPSLDSVCCDYGVCAIVVAVLWTLLESGVLPGCARLVVNCAATVSLLLLVRDFVCE